MCLVGWRRASWRSSSAELKYRWLRCRLGGDAVHCCGYVVVVKCCRLLARERFVLRYMWSSGNRCGSRLMGISSAETIGGWCCRRMRCCGGTVLLQRKGDGRRSCGCIDEDFVFALILRARRDLLDLLTLVGGVSQCHDQLAWWLIAVKVIFIVLVEILLIRVGIIVNVVVIEVVFISIPFVA